MTRPRVARADQKWRRSALIYIKQTTKISQHTSPTEARRIAADIAKLPELLRVADNG
jgi:hypothetical protein